MAVRAAAVRRCGRRPSASARPCGRDGIARRPRPPVPRTRRFRTTRRHALDRGVPSSGGCGGTRTCPIRQWTTRVPPRPPIQHEHAKRRRRSKRRFFVRDARPRGPSAAAVPTVERRHRRKNGGRGDGEEDRRHRTPTDAARDASGLDAANPAGGPGLVGVRSVPAEARTVVRDFPDVPEPPARGLIDRAGRTPMRAPLRWPPRRDRPSVRADLRPTPCISARSAPGPRTPWQT